MKNSLFITLFILVFQIGTLSFGQKSQNPVGGVQGGISMDSKIIGNIVDGNTGQPIEYAIIAVHKQKDSSLVTGSTSNSLGNFTIEGMPYGKFYCEVSFVGYKKQKIENVLLTPNQKTFNLGTIKINPTSTSINEVVVTGAKSPIEYKIDKKIVDVSSNLVAASGSVVDALQNTPSVQTDVEGNVTLRGSSNFTVLIDGKPSPITGSDALQQIPASTVQSVEIITNPSAKYDAEGSAGIINVIMKKQKITGLNGIINVTAGTGDKYSSNVNLNYKISKFNFTLGGDFNDMKFHNTMHTFNKKAFNNDTLLNQTTDGKGTFGRKGGGVKAGIEYNIDDNNTLSFSGTYGSRNMKRNFNTTNFDEYFYNQTGTYKDIYYRVTNNSEGRHKYYYNLNLDYQLKLDDIGQQLSASAYFSAGPDDDLTNLIQDTTFNNWLTDTSKDALKQYTSQTSLESELRTKLDYSLPIGEKGKLETGYQGKYSTSDAEYHFYNADKADANYEDIKQRDSLNFIDNVQAAYFTFSNSISLFDYQLGLRSEYEHRDIHQIKMDRIDYFPSVYLTRKLPLDLQLQASYTRRINRPRGWNLDPLKRYMSPTAVRVGNPGLLPEFSNSYELNLQKKINDASFISIEGFLRQTSNLMQHVNIFNAKTGITTFTSMNIDHDQSVGAELMLNLAPVKWFNFNSSSSIYNYQLFDSIGSKSTTSWNIRVNPTFRLMWGTSIQINYIYNAPTITTQGTRSGFYNTSIGIRQEVLKRKGSVTLNIQNPFGVTRMKSTSVSQNLNSTGYFQRESKVVMLTLSYRFNNYKVTQKQRQSEDFNNNDSEMNGGGGF